MRGIWTPLSTTVIPVSARIVSKQGRILAVPITDKERIRKRAWQLVSCRSIARLRTAWVTQAAVGCAVAPRIRTCRVACSITARTYIRTPVRVTVSKKSAARMASAWERRNAAQLCEVRSGAGSIPASLRISHTVEEATLIPSTSSSPWMRRYPQEVLSPHQAQHQPADRPERGWTAGTLGAGGCRVSGGHGPYLPTTQARAPAGFETEIAARGHHGAGDMVVTRLFVGRSEARGRYAIGV